MRLAASAATVASAFLLSLYGRVQWSWLVLGWVALVPWLAVLERTSSLRAALGAGLLMSVAFVLIFFGWFPSAIQNYTGAPWPLALLVVLLLAPVLEPQFMTFAVARHLARRGGTGAAGPAAVLSAGYWRMVLAGAGIYVGTEWAFPKLFTETLGHGLYPSALMRQAADIGGVPGLTFVLMIANECVLAALLAIFQPRVPMRSPGNSLPGGNLRQALVPLACAGALVLGLLAYGAVRIRQFSGDRPGGGAVTAGVVQADISQYGRLAAEMGTFDAVRMILDAHFALSAQALEGGDLDLLVWPETVYPTTFGAPKSAEGAAFDREIGAFVSRSGVPLVFGAYDAEGGEEFNAALFLEPAADGQVTFDAYRKASLFPLTERVPAVFESEWLRRWLPWLGTWKPGRGSWVLPLWLQDGRVLQVAPLICYDALDPGHVLAAVRQGAEIILTLSNDSWFAYGNVPRLILVMSAFRSLETRRPQVRATSTGVSAVVTATGEFLGTIGVHERATLVAAVTLQRGATTLMLVWGDWFGPSALVLGVVLLAAALVGGAPEQGRF